MKKYPFIKYAVPILLCSFLTVALSIGCVNTGDFCKFKYEKTEHLSAPFAPGQTLTFHNNIGETIVTGADVNECKVIATITAKATTQEKAEKLAEEVQIKLEPSGNKLFIRVEKPETKPKQSITVDFDITMPRQAALQLGTNVGEIKIHNITKPIKAEVNVGTVSCKEITDNIDIKTNVGEVKVIYSRTAPAICNANIKTDIGKIDFVAPPDLSAKVNASTNIGSIQTDLPLTVKGTISNRSNGIIGKGEGEVTLKTNIGSINIRQN